MSEPDPPVSAASWGLGLLFLAILAIAGSAVAFWLAPLSFFKAWLAAALLPWSVSIGSLTLLLIFELTGGRWGRAAWPWLEMNARLMPLVALLFVPWLCGIRTMFPWANSDILEHFENTSNRQWLFQVPFYVGRTALYFVVWMLLGFLVAGWPWGRRLFVESVDLEPPKILGGQVVAGLGLIAILLTVTGAGIDWIMSFDPFFTSTLFGGLIGIGAILSAMSATVAAVCFWKPLHSSATDDRTIGDLSNLLLAFLMLWAYFSFAQFLIMWSGDLPIEATFYITRTTGSWSWISPLLSIGGFVVPFLCLLSRDFKRSPRKIGTLALGLLAVRLVELWWMVLPTRSKESNYGWHWSVLPTTVAVVALYTGALFLMMRRAEHNRHGEAAE